MPTLTETILEKISDLHYAIFGSEKLLPYEEMCIGAWRETLTDSEKSVLDSQLKQVRLIQHQGKGAKVCFYYSDKCNAPLLAPVLPALHVATLFLGAEDRDDQALLRAKIFVHQGRFFSVEFAKRPTRFMQQHGIDYATLKVKNVAIINSLR